MSTYPSNGVTRESISLDEDDLTDVEDEVFIRDGRNGFKFAEDRGVKRPLMAPRRKLGKPDLASRLRNRPPCRVMCVPCCYAFAVLSVFLGLIMLIIILVSLFPLPIDKLKTWISNKSLDKDGKVFPCTDVNATQVWSYTLPKLTSESTMRALDVNLDGVDDIIFGFGLGEDVFLPEQWFCPMFLGVSPPCQGGLIALDGLTGKPIWTKWLKHPVFTLFCSADLNGDKIFDCLASGKGGVLCTINGRNGTLIWEFTSNKTSPIIDLYAGSFIPDQDNDTVMDIIASHTVQKGRSRVGFLTIISGKTGAEIVQVPTPKSAEIYYAPQLFTRFNGEKSVIYGTGGQNTPGALYMSSLKDIMAKTINPYKIYEDNEKGILSPVVLADITGDDIDDIISAMYNSTIIAFDGILFKQIWNLTIPNSESVSVPTPGYFNTDNVTDFLVKYQIGKGFPVYYYSQTLIIDGKTGKPIYDKPFIDNGGEQLQGLTARMENYGNDMFLYWMSYCKDYENAQNIYDFAPGSTIWQKTRADLCKLRFNSTRVTKLFGMNQYNEPPGILMYSSDMHEAIEYNNSLSPLETVKLYLKNNPDFNLVFKNPSPTIDKLNENVKFKQYNNYNRLDKQKVQNAQNSNFRHRDDGKTLIKDYMEGSSLNLKINTQDNLNGNPEIEEKYDYEQPDLPWNANPIDEMLDYEAYPDNLNPGRDQMLPKAMQPSNIPRDPRSRYPENLTEENFEQKSRKKNLSDEIDTINPSDYKNVKASRYRLLNDLNVLPNEILRETFERNKALRQSRDSKNAGIDDKDVDRKDAKTEQVPETLWDLESEKEQEDRENGYYRGRRETQETKVRGIPKVTSTGVLLKPLVATTYKNSIDLVFATYWMLPKEGAQILLEKDIECIKSKMRSSASKDSYQTMDRTKLEEIFTKMCLEERGIFSKPSVRIPSEMTEGDLQKSPYYNQIAQLTLGQMTIYRMHLECKCEILLSGERCAQVSEQQNWSSYLGKFATGYFNLH